MTKTQKSKSKNTMDDLFKKEKPYLLKINKCKTRKCLTHNKKRLLEYKKYIKEQDKQCTQKSNEEFYNCTDKFYKKSEYKKLFDKWVKCGKEKCSKEINDLRELRLR